MQTARRIFTLAAIIGLAGRLFRGGACAASEPYDVLLVAKDGSTSAFARQGE